MTPRSPNASPKPAGALAAGDVDSGTGRLVVRVGRTRLGIVLELVAIVTVVAGFVVVAAAWGRLPERVPVRFGVFGRPDRWGGRWALLLYPSMALLFYAGLSWLARRPHIFSYPAPITQATAARQYRIAVSMMNWLKTEVVLLLNGLLVMAVAVALGACERISPAVALGAMATIIGTVIVHAVQALRAR